MTTLASSFPAHFDTEDVMEMSNDPTRDADENEDIDIDLDFSGGQQQGEVDEEMTEEFDDPSMPFDNDARVELEIPDAPMEDHASMDDPAFQRFFEDGDIQDVDVRDDTIKDIEDKDLLDEIEDEIPGQEQNQITNEDGVDISNGVTSVQDEPDVLVIDEPSRLLKNEENIPQESEITEPRSDAAERKSGSDSKGSDPHDTLDKRDDSVKLVAADETSQAQHLSPEQEVSQPQSTEISLIRAGYGQSNQLSEKLTTESAEEIGEGPSSLDKIRENEQSDSLHPIIIIYQEEEISLFPPKHHEQDDSQTFLLNDESLAHGGILNLLSACRELLGDSIPEYDELEILMEDLDLKISESSATFPNISFAQMVDTYVKLHHNDGNTNPPPLLAHLYTITNCSRRWEHLSSLAKEGKGLSNVLSTENGESQAEEDFTDKTPQEAVTTIDGLYLSTYAQPGHPTDAQQPTVDTHNQARPSWSPRDHSECLDAYTTHNGQAQSTQADLETSSPVSNISDVYQAPEQDDSKYNNRSASAYDIEQANPLESPTESSTLNDDSRPSPQLDIDDALLDGQASTLLEGAAPVGRFASENDDAHLEGTEDVEDAITDPFDDDSVDDAPNDDTNDDYEDGEIESARKGSPANQDSVVPPQDHDTGLQGLGDNVEHGSSYTSPSKGRSGDDNENAYDQDAEILPKNDPDLEEQFGLDETLVEPLQESGDIKAPEFPNSLDGITNAANKEGSGPSDTDYNVFTASTDLGFEEPQGLVSSNNNNIIEQDILFNPPEESESLQISGHTKDDFWNLSSNSTSAPHSAPSLASLKRLRTQDDKSEISEGDTQDAKRARAS